MQLKKDSELASQLQEVDDDIKRYQEAQRRLKATQSCNSDDLDHFMENLTEEAAQLDKTEIRKLRVINAIVNFQFAIEILPNIFIFSWSNSVLMQKNIKYNG